ncbi:MAG: DUF488 domain-containing protein [Candidatus Eremiobacteraeota bacterium]|nr:DUF488 domain-containing protein [Candidatus Eremiobacteraeota bacterium]
MGHGTISVDAFLQLVELAQIQHIVDVRKIPRSQRHPQFAREAMESWLPQAGLSYRWEPRLGGFRRPAPDSTNVALRHPAFRGFADYMQTPEFWHAFDELVAEAETALTAVMCSESLWWRCHRRLIADAAVLTRGIEVEDLSHDGRLVPHRVTEGARVHNSSVVVYDVVDQAALLEAPRSAVERRPPLQAGRSRPAS